MQRRFRALCHHALAPAKAYFAKRHELRDARREDFSSVIARTEQQLAQATTPASESSPRVAAPPITCVVLTNWNLPRAATWAAPARTSDQNRRRHRRA